MFDFKLLINNFFKDFNNVMFLKMSSFLDFAKPYQLGFQPSASTIMQGIVNLHNHVMFYLTIVLVFTFSALIYILFVSTVSNKTVTSQYKNIKKLYVGKITHHAAVEFIWTVIPSLILLVIALPSFALLFSMDAKVDHYMSLKVIGHQWYWSYEYTLPTLIETNPDIPKLIINFDSYMIPTDELKTGQLRLLETDNVVWLPIKKYIKIEVTASDVLHSWAVPALGAKIDAIPGRSNEINLWITKEGTFYGQCSELCGVNHGFMPIQIHADKYEKFFMWVVCCTDEGFDMLLREMSFAIHIIFPNFGYDVFKQFPYNYTRPIRNAFFEDEEYRIPTEAFTYIFKETWKDY